MEDIIKVFRAIAVSDCSKDSTDSIFSHDEIIDFAKLILSISKTGNIFNLQEQKHKLLINCYLYLLGSSAVGANARSQIALNIIQILCPELKGTEAEETELLLKPAADPGSDSYRAIKNLLSDD